MSRKGRVVGIKPESITTCRVTQGIKRGDQAYYESSDRYKGGNGTYYHDFRTESHVMMKVVAYGTEEYPQQVVSFDIRDDIMRQNPEWKRLSPQRLNAIKDKIEHSKIDLYYDQCNNVIGYDTSILQV